MDYTGKHYYIDSKMLGHKVVILEYKDEKEVCHNVRWCYCDCDMCHKPIKRHMFVVQDAETDVEELYLGADCIKKFN